MSQLLRIATAGSVDDGKSTLIGRLLYDSKAIFEDQYEALEKASQDRGDEAPDLALLTDGLRAEREQGITIDVAYRYFATPRRKFIIADTPGHIQYTRNMVTGASTADAALILIDARKGVLEQSRRHAFLASLLGIPHLVLCVNKMDLVDWSREQYEAIRDQFENFATKLEVGDLTFVPMSALTGDNVVTRSPNMPWYEGRSLLSYIEELYVSSDRNLIDTRLPVQCVIRPHAATDDGLHDFRSYAGTIAGGAVRPGDEVTVLPTGLSSIVSHVYAPGGDALDEATPGQAVTVRLHNDLDIARGDMICRPTNQPHVACDVDAMVCWFSDDTTLVPGNRYVLQHTTRSTLATVTGLAYRLDIDTLHRNEYAPHLSVNEIGRVRLRTQQPLLFDSYRRNRDTGSFTLIDETTNSTLGAGMITGPATDESTVVWHDTAVSRPERATAGMTIWLTGLSGSGKSSVAVEVEQLLVAAGRPAYVLDGDNLRHGLNSGLSFTTADRAENVRRVGEVAALFADAGLIAIVSLVSPYRDDRDRVRAMHVAKDLPFTEIFVDTPIEICEARDPKGMYAKARAGKLVGFTGVDAPYEVPLSPELLLRPELGGLAEYARAVLDLVEQTIQPVSDRASPAGQRAGWSSPKRRPK